MQHPATEADDELIGTAAAAKLLHVERSTLTRWVLTGRIKPAMQLPGATGARLFRRTDIEALAATTAPGVSA